MNRVNYKIAVKFALAAINVTAACLFAQFWSSGQAAPSSVISSTEATRKSALTARSITWVTTLAEAMTQAKQNHKPIFWVHMLGNVEGFT